MADFHAIERKWQERWEKERVFEVSEDKKKKKFYCLEMFPYPSGEGLHMGHALNYTIGDIYARFKRMSGFNVLYPMGFDSFGLPAENAAIKAGQHPKDYTEKSMKNFIRQQKMLGLSYAWDRKVVTCDPEYYRWNQYFFLLMYKHGLIYRKKAPVNWCPKCQTVLANEQVHNGRCWRHEDTDVEIRHLEQWFVKTTDYAEELVKCISALEWPERIKSMQLNWIGKSHGIEIYFDINGERWPIFTTRPDTIYGVTFMVVSAQHARLMELVTDSQRVEVEAFLKRLKSVSEKELEEMEKDGVFTGSYATNPLTGDKVPVYAGNFVIADYGSGMVMAVPCHDQRDFEFAKKYNIPIKVVIQPFDFDLKPEKMSRAFVSEGRLANSGEFSGVNNADGIGEISKYIEQKGFGKKVVNYKLRDWLISRQRYWGTPIPIIYCDKCGLVPDDNLPILLPDDVKFGEGNPIATSKKFAHVKCPKCGGDGRRETDTMDTFFDSSWYFLRYTSPGTTDAPFELFNANYWMPVDQYIGGAEHACMHLIYARFFTKALRDMGLLGVDEPFTRLFNQGMLHASDGNKMSKSLGNIINPVETIERYSADTLRLCLMSLASPDNDRDWSDEGMQTSHRFLARVVTYYDTVRIGSSVRHTESKLNKAIKEVTSQIDGFKYNLAIINIKKLFELFGEEESRETLEAFIKLLHPFCPHITEELWWKLGNNSMLSLSSWPKYDESKIDETAEALEKSLDQTISDIKTVMELSKSESPKKITLFVAEPWKYDLVRELRLMMEETHDQGKILRHLMESELKKYSKDIVKLVPRILKAPGLLPGGVFDQDSEVAMLEANEKAIENGFSCSLKIVRAQDSYELKAHQALPGRPAILIE